MHLHRLIAKSQSHSCKYNALALAIHRLITPSHTPLTLAIHRLISPSHTHAKVKNTSSTELLRDCVSTTTEHRYTYI